MKIWLILAAGFAALELLAKWKNLSRLEYVAKPAVMVFLFAWLFAETGLQGRVLWFGLGILFSLAGDVFLMLPFKRMFFLGLIAFLFAHISYVNGFRDEILTVNAWSFLLVMMLSLTVIRVLPRITSPMRSKGLTRMIRPVGLYAIVITVMLYAALSTISNPAWKTSASFFVSAGAFLFYISDLLLAWNRFVNPIRRGRLFNIATYHLGQIGLIAGVISQFG